MQKYDIVNSLAQTRIGGRYLEICTPTTGLSFGQVDPERLPVRHRLMYRCPDGYNDGLPIICRTPADESEELVRSLCQAHRGSEGYDIIFVDPWHTYVASIADLHGALCLLKPDGIMVVHDCNPTDAATVTPEYRDGAWCGVTYRAFIDFALGSGAAGYCTVDCDYGVGVVFWSAEKLLAGLPTVRPAQRVVFDWHAARNDEQLFAVFERHRWELLNLITPSQFRAALGFPFEALPESDGINGENGALRVLAGGAWCAQVGYRDGWYSFALPPGVSEVLLLSPAFTPAEKAESADRRRLGIAVNGLRVGSAESMQVFPLDDSALVDGWHPAEKSASGAPWRWTNGQGRVPAPPGATLLEVSTVRRS